MKILNLTQHPATPEQIEAGVVDLTGENLAQLKTLLTFVGLPTGELVSDRAYDIAKIARDSDCDAVMIGGAPFLMPALQMALQRSPAITVLYAFSERVSHEKLVDGKVVKTQVFKHAGFVEIYC